MKKDSNSSNSQPKRSDHDVIGSYIKHSPEEPRIPDGSYANTIIGHVPKVIKLTYAQLIKRLFAVKTLVVENHLYRSLQERFDSDPRLKEYCLRVFPFDLRSKVIAIGRVATDFEVDRKNKWHDNLSRLDLDRDGYTLGRYIEHPGKTFRIFEVTKDGEGASPGLTFIADTRMDQGQLVRVNGSGVDFLADLGKMLPGSTLRDAL